MADTFYNIAKAEILDGSIDLLTDTLKVMLTTSGYTPSATDGHIDDGPSASELSGGGYARGTLAGKGVSPVDGSGNPAFDATDQTFSSLGPSGTATHAILFYDSGVASTSTLIAAYSLGSVITNGSDVVIQWNASGLFTLS